MKKTKHTRGEWTNAGMLGHGIWIAARGSDDPASIAVVYGPTSNPCGEANARLICAAPDMLAALQAYEQLDEHIANCDNCSEGIFPELCETGFPLADKARLSMRSAIAKAVSA